MGIIQALSDEPVTVSNQNLHHTELEKFQKIIEKKYNQRFYSYWEFHKWSVKMYKDFWREAWHYFGVIASKPYEEVLVKTGNGFLDNDWFSGARFNYAENILRIRDNRIALICADELGNEESVTYAEVFEEVKLYASAFCRHGLKVGDRVACISSNRKEALYAMLATTSIGGIWGGPLPIFSGRAQSNTVKVMEPKILIAVDHFQIDGKEYHPIDNLALVSENVPTLEKVVVVATKNETTSRLSDIPNSILLEDFLQSGREIDVPDIKFKQLPSQHPIAICFKAGMTDTGMVYSAGSLIAMLRDFALSLNLKSGDVLYASCPVGWSAWDDQIPCIALGIKLFLFDGYPPYNGNCINIWNMFSKYNVSYAYLTPSLMNVIEERNIVPDPGSNLESLQIISLGSSPEKSRNYGFLHNKVKKGLFIDYNYGGIFGTFTGFDFKIPLYKYESQVPALGVDLRCFDPEGNSVVGERGELVVTKPTPSFPIYLWKDVGHKRMKDAYFNKYEGVWCQNDEGWINPKTKGIVVIGRSENVMKQNEKRINSTDVYFSIADVEELQDYICIGQDGRNGSTRPVLFVKLKEGFSFTPELKEKIDRTIQEQLFDILLEVIIEIPDIPYNFNRKRMESVVKEIVATNNIPELMNCMNPDSLIHFCNIPELLNYNKK